ncbi:MAG: SusC/RagA family TonB-linked outer membrane protein [Bacteroidota bacterium]|nr:SusC/RagA family TonB-linked outer membrane protein [Bacteroidota bacterium]
MIRIATLASLFLLWGSCEVAMAQTAVQGRVTDDQGNALPSATVMTASGKGVFTDLDGQYTLAVSAGEQTLTFSFIGYLNTVKTVNVRAGEAKTLNIRLREDAVLLNESVVVGYGVQRKKEVTGAISTIDSKEITAVQTPSFEAALQGQAAGVQVTQGSGMAGSGSIVRIRGLSSISAGGDPLYVIDGIPITQDYFAGGNSGAMNRNPLASLNPNDIKDIQVLKDAAATGIYGSRGANGVILITTKRGVKKGIQVSYGSSIGYGEPTSRANMMNTEEYLTIRQEAWENDGGTGYVWLPYLTTAGSSPETRKAAFERAMETNTDWFDLFSRRAQKTQQNIGLRSGGEKWSMYNGVSYDKNESYAVGNSYTRTSARTNFDWTPNDKIKVLLSGSTSEGQNQRVRGGWSGGIGAAMSTALPYMAPYVVDSTFDANGSLVSTERNYELNRWFNPMAYQDFVQWRETERRQIATGQIIVTPHERLDIVMNGGYDNSKLENDSYENSALDRTNGFAYGNWSEYNARNYNVGANATFRAIDRDTTSLAILVGAEAQKFESDGFGFNLRDSQGPAYAMPALRDSLFGLHDSLYDAVSTVTNAYVNQYRTDGFASTFARVNYNLKDRYFFQATARVDGSSRFGQNNRFGFFPSAAAGWVISDEPSFKSETISFLKFRTSWGRTGNASIDGFSRFALYNDQTQGATYAGDTIVFPTQPGNPDLRWETVETIDASLEMGLWKDRVSVELGVYNKMASDVLMNVELPSHTGFNNRSVNAGQVLNRGVELGITSNNLPSTSELQWKTTLNYAYNYNELVNTGDFTEDAISGGTNDSRAVTGAPLTTYFLVPFSHVDPESGLPVYIDINGNETFEYNLEDRRAVGDGLPDHVGGLRNEFTFRNWTLSTQFTGAFGAKIWDSSAKRQLGVVTDWNMRTDLFDRWRQPGDIASFPRLTMDETTYGLPAGFPWWNTSLFMYDASYIRLRNASISYRLPSTKGDITLRLSGNNLFVLTNFIGLDPELTRDFENRQDRNFSGGANYLTAPQERSVIFAINANF